jgi:hypothetical protein
MGAWQPCVADDVGPLLAARAFVLSGVSATCMCGGDGLEMPDTVLSRAGQEKSSRPVAREVKRTAPKISLGNNLGRCSGIFQCR